MPILKLLGRVEPILPVNILTCRCHQKLTIEDPYSINTLIKLPAFEAILAAYQIKVIFNICTAKRLYFMAFVSFDKSLKTDYIPALLVIRYR